MCFTLVGFIIPILCNSLLIDFGLILKMGYIAFANGHFARAIGASRNPIGFNWNDGNEKDGEPLANFQKDSEVLLVAIGTVLFVERTVIRMRFLPDAEKEYHLYS